MAVTARQVIGASISALAKDYDIARQCKTDREIPRE